MVKIGPYIGFKGQNFGFKRSNFWWNVQKLSKYLVKKGQNLSKFVFFKVDILVLRSKLVKIISVYVVCISIISVKVSIFGKRVKMSQKWSKFRLNRSKCCPCFRLTEWLSYWWWFRRTFFSFPDCPAPAAISSSSAISTNEKVSWFSTLKKKWSFIHWTELNWNWFIEWTSPYLQFISLQFF